MNFKKYLNNIAYPLRINYNEYAEVTIKTKTSVTTRTEILFDKERYNADIKIYRENENRLIELFKSDLINHLGIEKNAKAKLLVDMAFERKYSDSGFEGVVEEAEWLSALLT